MFCIVHTTFGRVEHDSQSWIKRRSISNHGPRCVSRMLRTPARVQDQGTCIVICRRFRCLGVMVWSALTTHWTLHDPGRKTTSLSFVAFERSIGADVDSPGRSKLSVRTHVPTERTTQVPSNLEGFEGMNARLHHRRCQPKVFLVRPRQSELPEVNTTREG